MMRGLPPTNGGGGLPRSVEATTNHMTFGVNQRTSSGMGTVMQQQAQRQQARQLFINEDEEEKKLSSQSTMLQGSLVGGGASKNHFTQATHQSNLAKKSNPVHQQIYQHKQQLAPQNQLLKNSLSLPISHGTEQSTVPYGARILGNGLGSRLSDPRTSYTRVIQQTIDEDWNLARQTPSQAKRNIFDIDDDEGAAVNEEYNLQTSGCKQAEESDVIKRLLPKQHQQETITNQDQDEDPPDDSNFANAVGSLMPSIDNRYGFAQQKKSETKQQQQQQQQQTTLLQNISHYTAAHQHQLKPAASKDNNDISIANFDDDSLIKVECTHCRRQFDIQVIDKHEHECQEEKNNRLIDEIIRQQDMQLDREEDQKKEEEEEEEKDMRRGGLQQSTREVVVVQSEQQQQFEGPNRNMRYHTNSNQRYEHPSTAFIAPQQQQQRQPLAPADWSQRIQRHVDGSRMMLPSNANVIHPSGNQPIPHNNTIARPSNMQQTVVDSVPQVSVQTSISFHYPNLNQMIQMNNTITSTQLNHPQQQIRAGRDAPFVGGGGGGAVPHFHNGVSRFQHNTFNRGGGGGTDFITSQLTGEESVPQITSTTSLNTSSSQDYLNLASHVRNPATQQANLMNRGIRGNVMNINLNNNNNNNNGTSSGFISDEIAPSFTEEGDGEEERKVMFANPAQSRPRNNINQEVVNPSAVHTEVSNEPDFTVGERRINLVTLGERRQMRRAGQLPALVDQRQSHINIGYYKDEEEEETSSDEDQHPRVTSTEWNAAANTSSRAPASGQNGVSASRNLNANERYASSATFHQEDTLQSHYDHHYPQAQRAVQRFAFEAEEESSLREDHSRILRVPIQRPQQHFEQRQFNSYEAELSNNQNSLQQQRALQDFALGAGLNMRQSEQAHNHYDQSPPPIIFNNSSSMSNNNEQEIEHYILSQGGGSSVLNFDLGGAPSLVMPMRLPDNQMSFLNPNTRLLMNAADNLNSTGVQSSKTTSRSSSIQREQANADVHFIGIQQQQYDMPAHEDHFTDDEEDDDSHANPGAPVSQRRVFVQRELINNDQLDGGSRMYPFEDVLVDEIDMRSSARENSISRSMNMRPMHSNYRNPLQLQQQQQPNLRPRIQPFNQARINNDGTNHRLNDSDTESIYDNHNNNTETAQLSMNHPLGLNIRRAIFLPFILNRSHARGTGLGLQEGENGDDEVSDRSYNFAGEEGEATFIEQIVNRANAFRNFDDYEALLNLDDNVVMAVPERIVQALPVAEFTEGNRENFSEENKSCTICMSQYELKEEYMILPCLHRFHTDCIKEWFNRRNTCPNCKDRIMDHFEGSAACHPRNPSDQLECHNPMMRFTTDGIGRINIAESSVMMRGGADEHNFIFEEEKSDNDEEESDDTGRGRFRRVQYVQGQSIQRFEPRSRFISNREDNNGDNATSINQIASNNIRSMLGLQQNNNSTTTTAMQRNYFHGGGGGGRSTFDDPSFLQSGDHIPAQAMNHLELRFRREANEIIIGQSSASASSASRVVQATGIQRPHILQRQQQQDNQYIDFDVGSVDDENQDGEPQLQEEEEESSLR